jgi:hypothetical protein
MVPVPAASAGMIGSAMYEAKREAIITKVNAFLAFIFVLTKFGVLL